MSRCAEKERVWPPANVPNTGSPAYWLTASPNALVQLFAGVSKNAPCHDHQVDLLCALEDVVDLRVTHPLLEQELARIPERAEDLDRFLGALRHRQAGLGLAHRCFQVVVHATVHHPCGAPGQQAGSL